jgi:hypothetical protein
MRYASSKSGESATSRSPGPRQGWEWATNGRFPGRWDDRDGNFRTVYAGSTLLACLLQVLADFRPDPMVLGGLDDIVVDADDDSAHPTAAAGTIDPSWLEPRAAATARSWGRFCGITTHDSLAALHAQFVGQALLLGLRDFDAAALKDGRTRTLTQAVSTELYRSTGLNGIRFASRHGDDLALWAVFERPGDGSISPHLEHREHQELHRDHPDLRVAFALLGLRWSEELKREHPWLEPPTSRGLALDDAAPPAALRTPAGPNAPRPARDASSRRRPPRRQRTARRRRTRRGPGRGRPPSP